MLMFRIAKQKNFGTIVRSAAAFGIEEVFMIDQKYKKIKQFGSQGTADKMDYKMFKSLKDVRTYCTLQKISICGIEIIEGARPI